MGVYPHARRAGDFLFLSGVGPRARGTKIIPGVVQDSEGHVLSEDIEVQCRSCFANARAVVEDAGARWEDVVDATVYLTHMKRDFAMYNKIWAECFTGLGFPNPTRTTLEILALPTPISVEVKLVVYAPLKDAARG